MLQEFNQMIIPYYSPISAKGGRRRRRTRKYKRSNKSRTRRRHN